MPELRQLIHVFEEDRVFVLLIPVNTCAWRCYGAIKVPKPNANKRCFSSIYDKCWVDRVELSY